MRRTASKENTMDSFPHHYSVDTSVSPQSEALLSADGVSTIASLPPRQFGGPGDHWPPEELLVASVAGCFALNFKAIAAASKFTWTSLDARTEGVLDRIEGKMRFVRIHTHAKLSAPAGADWERAKRLLEKAEATCPISNTLNCPRELTVEVVALSSANN
jgi:peroxiredoxin-like protein